MTPRIVIHLNDGQTFTTASREKMTNDQIFHELLMGNNKYIQIANMCIVKDRINAIVIEEDGYPEEKIETKEPTHTTYKLPDSMSNRDPITTVTNLPPPISFGAPMGVMEEYRTDIYVGKNE